ALGEAGHEPPLEVGDVGAPPAPDQLPVAERRGVAPLGAGVHQVVLDSERAGRTCAAHDAGRDRDEPAVADDPHRAAARVHAADELDHPGVATQLVGRPPAGDDEAVESLLVDVGCDRLRLDAQPVLAAVLRRARPPRHAPRPPPLQAHHGAPVLEAPAPIGTEPRVAPPLKPHQPASPAPPPRPARAARRSITASSSTWSNRWYQAPT